jgi:sulfhydrogenase subunit alpha
LHIYLLHAPDFLCYGGALEMAKDRRDIVERGLALKNTGNEILEVLGSWWCSPYSAASSASVTG